ncbi:MAG TPA: DinB family protein [Pyrinomonadaceae bacterium]
MNSSKVIINALENAPAIIVPLVREVPVEVLKRRPQPRKWSAHEHACHLAEVHPLFFQRLDLMLKETRPRILSYNPDEAMQEGSLLSVDLDEALERFARDRARLVERLKELSDADWRREADHEEYDHYSVQIMFRHVAMHDMLHAYRIEELLLKKGLGGKSVTMSASAESEPQRPAYTEAHLAAYPVEYFAGIDLFNEGEFHAAHDAWEDRWMGEVGPAEKLFLQAMIQSAVAFHHLEIGRPGAARRMYQMAKEKFARLGVRVFMSLDLEEYQAQLDRALSWLLTVADPRELTQPEMELPVIRLLPEVTEYD